MSNDNVDDSVTKPSLVTLQRQLVSDVSANPDQANLLIYTYLDAAFSLGKQMVLRELAKQTSKIIKDRDDE